MTKIKLVYQITNNYSIVWTALSPCCFNIIKADNIAYSSAQTFVWTLRYLNFLSFLSFKTESSVKAEKFVHFRSYLTYIRTVTRGNPSWARFGAVSTYEEMCDVN